MKMILVSPEWPWEKRKSRPCLFIVVRFNMQRSKNNLICSCIITCSTIPIPFVVYVVISSCYHTHIIVYYINDQYSKIARKQCFNAMLIIVLRWRTFSRLLYWCLSVVNCDVCFVKNELLNQKQFDVSMINVVYKQFPLIFKASICWLFLVSVLTNNFIYLNHKTCHRSSLCIIELLNFSQIWILCKVLDFCCSVHLFLTEA